MDLSIQRGAQVVSDGLASHVWMETPDATYKSQKIFDRCQSEIMQEGKRIWPLQSFAVI